MSLAGITWYQGEANTANATTAQQYSCLFPQMISAWRTAFQTSTLWFGFIQLSTWCALPPASLPQMRDAQMAALALPNVGYATNADHGFGCAIHPAAKQYCAVRLAKSALAMHYNKSLVWRSPTYASAQQLEVIPASKVGTVQVRISLHDVPREGLRVVRPANYDPPQYGSNWSHSPGSGAFVPVDCSATFPAVWPNKTKYNASMESQCAWSSICVRGVGWLNATASVAATGHEMILTAQLPTVVQNPAVVTATSYGWGPIPMLSVYVKDADLPVLPWNETMP